MSSIEQFLMSLKIASLMREPTNIAGLLFHSVFRICLSVKLILLIKKTLSSIGELLTQLGCLESKILMVDYSFRKFQVTCFFETE